MFGVSNWGAAQNEGWRFVQNLSSDAEASRLRVACVSKEFGIDNVMIGTAFEQGAPTDPLDLAGFALYVRDLKDQIAGLYEDILNLECGHGMTVEEAA